MSNFLKKTKKSFMDLLSRIKEYNCNICFAAASNGDHHSFVVWNCSYEGPVETFVWRIAEMIDAILLSLERQTGIPRGIFVKRLIEIVFAEARIAEILEEEKVSDK